MSKKEIIIKGGTKRLTFHKAEFPELERIERENTAEDIEAMGLQDFLLALNQAGKDEHAEQQQQQSGQRAPEEP